MRDFSSYGGPKNTKTDGWCSGTVHQKDAKTQSLYIFLWDSNLALANFFSVSICRRLCFYRGSLWLITLTIFTFETFEKHRKQTNFEISLFTKWLTNNEKLFLFLFSNVIIKHEIASFSILILFIILVTQTKTL